MKRKTWLFIGLLVSFIGSFYEFVPRTVIKSIHPTLIMDIIILGKRIRQNDLILLGTILLIFGFVCMYKFVKMK